MIHKTTRSILSVLLAALLLVTSIPLTPAFADGGAVSLQSESGEGRGLTGDGTKSDPYQIGSAEDLRKFAELVNGGKTDAHAKLMNNIDLSSVCGESNSWTPIGNSIDKPYEGTFNGNGHTISGLYIYTGYTDQGLFGYVSGTVQNLTVDGTVSGINSVGGVVGSNGGNVEDCAFTGSVSGVGPVGGVVGHNDGGRVENCYNTGSVTSIGSPVGGVVGYNDSGGSVTNCYNTGTVSSTSNSGDPGGVGGVVGDNGGTVKNCYNTGSVTGTSNYVGGVVGWNISSVTNCYNTGSVTGSNSPVGGVVGYNISSVTNCYNTGSVSGPDSVSGSYVGGVVGLNSSSTVTGTVTGCYFLQQNDVPAQGIGSGEEIGATGLTADQFKNTDSFTDWDFGIADTTTWSIHPVLGRPVLNENREGGLGTDKSPYEISTATELKNFRDLVNREGGNPDAHAKLMNDINLSSVCGPMLDDGQPVSWTPIGNSEENAYTGTFNGAGHTISGLYIDRSANYQGLFGRVNGGTVQNLSVSGSVKGDDYVGGVVGQNGGSVENCYNTGAVNSSGNRVGGVVGYNSRIVKNCYNTGAVNSSGNWVGGVVGVNSGSVTNCYNTVNGTVTVTGNDYVGGVVGYNSSNGTVENCYNTVKVTGSSDYSYIGGVVGQNFGPVENCYNTGSVTVTGSDGRVGGVVGWNSGPVKNCYNTGTVSDGTGTDDCVGGVVGLNGGTVENCHNIGEVSGKISVGGVVGFNSGPVKNCYNTGTVSDGTTSGGVVGKNFGSGTSAIVENCYFLQTETVNTKLPGIGDGSGDATEKDDTAFHSGEVAYLLEQKVADSDKPVWGQNIGEEDSWPTLIALDNSAQPVYQVTVVYGDYADAPKTETSYTNNPAEPAAPARDGYTFGGWDKTGEGTTTITYTAKWTAEEPPYTGKYSYELSTSVGDHGSLTVDRYATEGDEVTIAVSPDEAYKLDDLSVTANGKDVALTDNGDGTFSFTMPSADVKISATFAEDPDWTPDEPEEPATDVSDLFIDIAPNAWYKDAIQYAYDNGLMTGVSATEFAPEQTTTRAMIVSILARLEGVTTAEAAGFADVDDNDWYATAVNWAANVGVVNGYEDNTFQPNTAITREQLAAILMNYAAYKGEDVSNRADLTSYTDQPSTWAEEAMQWAVAEKLISGVTADTLQPQGAATRAQVAAILQRYLEA